MELVGKLNKEDHNIVIEEGQPGHYSVVIDGVHYDVNCTERNRNLYSIIEGDNAFEARVSEPDATNKIDVQLYGDSYEVTMTDAMEAVLAHVGPSAQGVAALLAEMPGKVVRLLVEEGQEVEEGQPLLVLVAMKMENELESPKSGIIQKILVNAGDNVETGAQLLLVE